MSSAIRVWFITGSSSGLGRLLAELVLSRGEIVVATLRNPSALDPLVAKYPSSQLLVLKCDVCIPSDITAAFAKMKAEFGRCDIVFNNAGYPVMGEVEGTSNELSRPMFEVNFWGAASVNAEAVKFFREVNLEGTGGKLWVMSTMAGILASPGLGYYSASRAALESLTEALAQELDPAWNIKITIIEPGPFDTKAIKDNMVFSSIHPAYTSESLASQMLRKFLPLVPKDDPEKGVKVLYRLADEPEPPTRLPLGKSVVGLMKKKISILSVDATRYESWSNDLAFDQKA